MGSDYDDDEFAQMDAKPYEPKLRPRLMAAVLFAAVVTGGGLAYVQKSSQNAARPTKSDILKGRDEHLRMLEDTKKNLTALTDYVTNQVERLRSTNALLGELEKQRDRLKPLVETDLQTVNALFQAQEERTRQGRWLEWGLSFVMGVLSSILAACLLGMFQKWRRFTLPKGSVIRDR